MIRLLSYQPWHLSGPGIFPGTTKTLRETMTRFHEKEKEETCNIILQTPDDQNEFLKLHARNLQHHPSDPDGEV
ncbi:MAG TPA: hypothetical protein PK005_10745 [Bacteroidales bacterium]|jgi:hypothetical protein|nr:hypothetical protein [Bacteroidales bacterium]MDI9532294.1 hypothetical protein [Bacteroidota bacterium]MBK7731813.1 hypothetical protein [Bacteroidales bacterium]MBP7035335.1 hypothetical protein [Bacteroidales bacterium]MBP8708524.1 hypothetical protein [Bacteroidales bacterium]